MQLFDTAIQTTRANTQSTLANLAESTGGALIANTNDFRTPLRKLAEDIETYYEISYNPDIKNYDGSFRKITINMSSSDFHVQSRSGYIALPPAMAANGDVLHAFEVPLLRALDSPALHATGSMARVEINGSMHFKLTRRIGMRRWPTCSQTIVFG